MLYDDFMEQLKQAGLSKEDFAKLTNLTRNTLIGWATSRQGRKTQPWVNSWIDLYIKNRDKDIIIKALKN
jgi:transcriptional regulator with XRE-family HTH domain